MILTIVIPVFNEEATIKEIIRRVKKIKIQKEIVVIDDASSDNSFEILSKLSGIKLLRHNVNLGKGAAVRTGIKKSVGEIILIQDADLEYDPNDYLKLLQPILNGEASIVYGTRLKNYPVKIFGKKHTPFLTHYFGNKLLSFATRILYSNNLTDMETGYKVFRKDVLKNIKLESNRFEFEPEITAKILKAGYKIYEVPIKVNPRGYDEGKKITWKDGFKAIWTLIKYRFIN
ncbi:MAG: glycosyltransferase family 2 protein [Patescibacteria group bacterium]